MAYNVITDPVTPVTDIASWIESYKESHIEHSHDQAALTMVSPDESFIVVGPPRLQGDGVDNFHLVGLVNGFQFTNQAQVQPIKAIGSRRHLFSRSNAPVSGTFNSMLIYGNNMLRALYALTESGAVGSHKNSKFAHGDTETASWYTNLEEDIFRFPIGIGIIYGAPITAQAGGTNAVGAEYIEVCQIQARSVGITPGQPTVIENVQFIADRVIPWTAYKGAEFDAQNPASNLG